MKKLLDSANRYVEQCDWKDLSMLKLCLCSAGILVGTALPKKAQKPAVLGAAAVFVITYIPLMTKFIRIVMPEKQNGEKRAKIHDE